jgi:MFS family permease
VNRTDAAAVIPNAAATMPSPCPRPLWPAYLCESLSSVGAVMLTVGIFFFTERYFRWGLAQNFALAAAQGAVYVIGSLAANRIAARFGRRRGLIALYCVLTLLALLAAVAATPAWLVVALLVYVLVIAMCWPALESLVASDADAYTMSKRVGAYNLVWSGANAVTFAVCGAIITHWRPGIFIIPALAHAISALIMWLKSGVDPAAAAAAGVGVDAPAHAEPEPELLGKRTLAMWLARISLPATYVVVYSLAAMMPLLPVMQPLETAQRTLAGSVWMVARFLAFLYLGATVWWHTRPRILLVAAAAMLVAFLGVTVRPADVFSGAVPFRVDLAAMVGWQIALGAVMGMIYSASLYFGMVLSDGSTEHGGYHEALIGLGSILGPGTAALTQLVWRGDLRAGIAAVCCIIGLSVVAAAVATVKASSRSPGFPTS